MDRGLAVEKATLRTFRGKEEHPRREMPSVVCGTPYAMKHAAGCLGTTQRTKAICAKRSVHLSRIACRADQPRCLLQQLERRD